MKEQKKELGVNLSNSFEDEREKTELQIAIEDFFNQDDVSSDTKKMVTNADHDEKVPIRYRLSTIDSLHEKFLSESHFNCNVLYFKKNIPFFVTKPNPNDWGTCCFQRKPFVLSTTSINFLPKKVF